MSQRTDKLTDRERQVVELVAAGLRNREIARELCIAKATVENHLHHIFEKLEVNNRVQAARLILMESNQDQQER